MHSPQNILNMFFPPQSTYWRDAVAVEPLLNLLSWQVTSCVRDTHVTCRICKMCYSVAWDTHTHRPFWMTSSRIRVFSSVSSTPSLEARKRRERCWFILARGAWSRVQKWVHSVRAENVAPRQSLTTPSMAMYKTLLGRTILNRRSMYSKMATIISSSFLGAGLCKHQNRHYEKKWTSGRSYGTTANAYCSFAIYTFKMNNFYEWQNYKWPPSLWILITKKQKKTWNDHLKPTHP